MADRREHLLKIWPSFFEPVATGAKRFEVRSIRDRDFAVGDVLYLREWDPQEGRMVEFKGYTARTLETRVTYVMLGGRMGLDEHTAILGISEPVVGKMYNDGVFYPDAVPQYSEQPSGDLTR